MSDTKTRKPRLNRFSGTALVAKVSPVREAAENWMLKNACAYTVDQIAAGIGHEREAVRKKLVNMAVDGTVVSLTPRRPGALYQHMTHWREQQRRAGLVNRREPITNASMPNGSLSFWADHMARFNTPPRAT